MARETARDNCDQCPHPKLERDEEATLANGVRLSVHVAHCTQPTSDCTAQVCSHLLSEPPEVANSIIKHLAEVPELATTGVSWMGCLAPGADRLILTYRIPDLAQVAEVTGALQVKSFRQ